LKRLKEVNENLKKYASVNRKALDQYVSFNEQRENLVGRKEELIRDTSAIEQLVRSLDSQKVTIEQRESLKIDSDYNALDML
jgi:structural maintenance of chromosome 3 (chondroitin sulfate proteoglycan 6)